MSELYPTKTRLALLQDVADGWVWFHYVTGESILEPDREGPIQTKVTGRMDEMYRAGWVTLPPMCSRYELTDAGRAVLDTHGGQQK